jgi:sugar phosphate isomerase/epimerase
MAVAARSEQRGSILSTHHPLGASTGYMEESRGDWPTQVAEAWEVSPFAVELSALSERQLESLRDYLASAPALPFRYLSIHGPSKDRAMAEEQLLDALCELAQWADAIVMHPDTLEWPERYRALGRKLLLENMDARKDSGRTFQELAPLLDRLPEAGFCFDVAHASSVSADMSAAAELLDGLGDRLRHVHVSSLSPDLRHVPLSDEDEQRFQPILARCVDVPWILEAPLRSAGGIVA